MVKHKSRESSSSSGGTPYEGTLRNTCKVNYSDTEAPEIVDPGRGVDPPVDVGASEAMPAQAAYIVPVPGSSKNVPRGPINTWVVERESLDYLNHAHLTAHLTSLLASCTHRASLFAAAIQRFEIYLQFFVSTCASAHPAGTADVLATLRAATHMGDEVFLLRRDYTIAVTMLRYFVAGLLQRLFQGSEVRDRDTMAFNELSRVYEEAEYGIRDTIEDFAHGKAEGGVSERLGVYMEAFKRRGEILGAQQGRLEGLARDCLVEFGKGGVGV
ncbi:hypothetical protein DPSP01_005519 [Paraphaeosphaeria sporulosa]